MLPLSLAQWSLHRAFFGGELCAMDFAAISRQQFGIDAIEYVNSFYRERANDPTCFAELKRRADHEGVRSLLIMIDGCGDIGDSDEAGRARAIEAHKPWMEAAAALGCHSIRVNARSSGTPEEQARLAADGLRRLVEAAKPFKLNVLVENHGGISSNGAWLAGVLAAVGDPRCGSLPDFGNFLIEGETWYDRYKGVRELMPFAKAVSAKSNDFDEQGNETRTDYAKMMRIVIDAGYRGHVGIEYEGERLPEPEGVRRTKALLDRVMGTMKVESRK